MTGEYSVHLYEEIHPVSGKILWASQHPELPGCWAQGDTVDEARDRLNEAREAYIRVLRRESVDVPPPNRFQYEWQVGAARWT